MNILNLCLILFITIGLIILLVVFLQRRKKRSVSSAMGYRLLQALMPKASPEESSKKKPAEFISLFDQLLGSLANYNNPLVWEMAVPTNSDQIEFYWPPPKE